MNSKLNNVLNELNKQPQNKWADYGTIVHIFESNGTDWNNVNDMFGSSFDELLTIDDIESCILNRIECNKSDMELNGLEDDWILKSEIEQDKKELSDYKHVSDDALYQYCEGGDFEFYRLTNEDVVMMLSSLV